MLSNLLNEKVKKDGSLWEIIEVPPRSRRKVLIKGIDRGEGWNEETQAYGWVVKVLDNPEAGEGAKKIIRRRGGRGNNFGETELVHINQVEFLNQEA